MCSRADSLLWFSVPLSARSLPLPVILSPLCSLRHEKKQICRDACGLFCQLKRVESLERVLQSWDNKNVFFSSSLSYLDNFISCCKRGEKVRHIWKAITHNIWCKWICSFSLCAQLQNTRALCAWFIQFGWSPVLESRSKPTLGAFCLSSPLVPSFKPRKSLIRCRPARPPPAMSCHQRIKVCDTNWFIWTNRTWFSARSSSARLRWHSLWDELGKILLTWWNLIMCNFLDRMEVGY